MGALIAASTVPGTLYIDGRPAAALSRRPVRTALGEAGAYVLFAPHEDGYVPVAREIRIGEDAMPEGVGGLDAVVWPGGTLEVYFRPMRAHVPHIAATAPFADGSARLLKGDRVLLDVDGMLFPVGDGPGCGLRELPGGWLAAFAQEEQGESLLIVAPGVAGPESMLRVSGEQVMLSQDGLRVRVQEYELPGAAHRSVREYRREDDGFEALAANVIPSPEAAASPRDAARALTAAILLGAYDDALAMLTPSLRSVVDSRTLADFFGPFDGYTDARHATPPPGLELLALLRPVGGMHVARLMAFEVVKTQGGLRIENVKAWE